MTIYPNTPYSIGSFETTENKQERRYVIGMPVPVPIKNAPASVRSVGNPLNHVRIMRYPVVHVTKE